ncbi:MAG: hypothetical protein JST69_11905 [Bacteroidetes bacterium]|nr:hypothetical protein [Bacteroidota bacterium]
MKTPIFTFLLFASLVAQATIRTVSNDINKPAQYPDIPPAVAAASAGDTIYVNGTQYTYSDITINKRLVLIGAGYNVPNQFNLISAINNIYFFKDAGINDGSGSVITGFKVGGSIAMGSGSLGITNIKIFRNQITYITMGGCTNWTIYNNLFNAYVNGQNSSSSILIQNNIFTAGSVTNFNQPSVIIDHNLFINTTGLQTLQFVIITNNIFTSSSSTAVWYNVTQCTFNNNMSVSSTISTYTPTNSFLANNNTGGSNQVGVNPAFVNDADFNNYNNTFNYRLTSGSPGHNAATDASDIGIYGGSYPFPSGGAPGSGYDTSPLPPIPQVNSVNIQNASVLPGQQLQVNVTATVNN